MPDILIDPTSPTNGAGTLADPRNVLPTAVAYGDRVLFKEGTVTNLAATGWTVPAPSGVPSLTNQLLIGTYDAATGLPTLDPAKRAQLSVTGNSDVLLIQHNHVRVENLYLFGARTAPSAGVRALNSSHITVRGCRINSGPVTTGGGTGIRLDNATGSGASRTDWNIIGNIVERTGGNSSIVVIWGANAGEFVTDVTITDNVVVGNPAAIAATVNHGFFILSRSTNVNTNRAGLQGKGFRIERNVVTGTHGYGYHIYGIGAGGSQPNVFRGNKAFEIGDGATDAHCMWLSGSDDWVVEDNLVDGSNAWVGQTIGTAVGIFIDRAFVDVDGCNRIRVRNNVVRNTGRGGTLNTELGGAGIAVFLGSDVIVESNIVEKCPNGIIALGSFGGGAMNRIQIRNNIVSAATESSFYTVKRAENVVLTNNISIGAKYGFALQNTGVLPVTTGYVETSNLVFGASVFDYMGSNEPEAAVYTTTSRTAPGGALSFDPRPHLNDDFSLRVAFGTTKATIAADNPLAVAGTYIQGVRLRNGRMRPGWCPIGAYQAVLPRAARAA